ncbi:hypothetical protein M0805_005510 [Coniferiporia weirii]|nr:hypothetical protein M0805_005510 [Coniferiporia weirii]
MSRRDSRVHISVRQNDTLLEFENFKKKFLFANKQITKQNCSLSLKIEELNAHISTLYVENLRLRASEIALQSQLKREREKCQKIMSDAEVSALNLLKHFGIIRQSYNVPTEQVSSPKGSASSSPTPQSQRPPPRSPSALRLAQFPGVPDIAEDPEPHETSSEENEQNFEGVTGQTSHSSRRPRRSISRLPLPSRVALPPPIAVVPQINLVADVEEGSSRKRKLMRRPSGLMPPPDHPSRPISPVLGSPTQKAFNLSEEEEAAALQDVEDIALQEQVREQEEASKKPRKKVRTREESDQETVDKRERKKTKDRDGISVMRLKDVTNSPRRRRAPSIPDIDSDGGSAYLASIHLINIWAAAHKGRGTPLELPAVGSYVPKSSSPLMSLSAAEEDAAYLPTPAPSSAANTPVVQRAALPAIEGDGGLGGRERRTRKSVNYAEPKLNTKMRKPDSIPPPGARPSLTPATTPADGNSARSSPEIEDPTTNLGRGSSLDAVVRRRSTTSTAVSKRKRLPRQQSDDGTDDHDEDETDGGDADAEFSDFRSGWANVNTRRKSVQNDSASEANGDSNTGYRRARRELEDSVGRRHSIAV